MTNLTRVSTWAGAALAAVLSLAARDANAQQTPPSITLGVHQPLVLPLLQDDPTTMAGGNPAVLGFAGGVHLDLSTQSDAYGLRQAGGMYFSAGTSSHASGGINLGLGYESIEPQANCDVLHPCDQRSTLAVAVRLGWLAAGWQIHSFKSSQSQALDGLVSMDAGLALRPNPCLSLGVASFDANSPKLNGLSLPGHFQGSIAGRPLCSERLTLELDADVNTCGGTPAFYAPGSARGCGLGNPDVRASIEYEAFQGIRVLGALQRTAGDQRLIAEIGFAMDFGHLGVRAAGTGAPGYGYLAANIHLSSESYPTAGFIGALADRAVSLNLTKALERETPDLFAILFNQTPPDPLTRTLETLRRLRRDSHVHAIVLSANGLPTSLAGAEELRSEIAALRAAGKRIVFFLENGGDLEYYVASSADRVFATPRAILDINGFSATVFFAAAGLDKLGVKAEFFRVGAYKNAPDLFTRSEMSAEQREVESSLLGDIASRYVAAAIEARGASGLTEAELRALLDEGIVEPQEAVDAGLLDGLLYEDQLDAAVSKLLERPVKLHAISTDAEDVREARWGVRPKLLVVRVEGAIGMEDQPASLFAGRVAGARSIAGRIRKAADDSSVAAIVVRIDSPGGDGNASDVIWRELIRARKEKGKPVVVSMGEYAASGGYYVAAAADAIWAEPSTITGSIGVFSGHFDASELLGKLGVRAETVKTNESADIEALDRALTPKERLRMQKLVDNFYKAFVDKVAEGRGLSFEQVDAVARGRVWTGAQARAIGLVDRLGGFHDAIDDAKARAGLTAEQDIELDDPRNGGDAEAGRGMQTALRMIGLDGLFSALGLSPALPRELAWAKRALESLDLIGEPDTVRACLPYSLEIH